MPIDDQITLAHATAVALAHTLLAQRAAANVFTSSFNQIKIKCTVPKEKKSPG